MGERDNYESLRERVMGEFERGNEWGWRRGERNIPLQARARPHVFYLRIIERKFSAMPRAQSFVFSYIFKNYCSLW
jgi:hypothetical protein